MITVVGGFYRERCLVPEWNNFYGSAGRAAAALARQRPGKLITYVDRHHEDELKARAASWGTSVDLRPCDRTVYFDYVHPLSVPVISPRPEFLRKEAPISLTADHVLRFGMMEGDAEVKADVAVYDPQSATSPRFFRANGSTAQRLAIVANGSEARLLTDETDPVVAARAIASKDSADVVVVKRGSRGAVVLENGQVSFVPAYRTEYVFPIGSGDIFAAAFAHFWMDEGIGATEAADLASRTTARYCETRDAAVLTKSELEALAQQPVSARDGRVYLAGPFFTTAQRWLIEEVRENLRAMGLSVFSPIHDVGRGGAEQVAPADLEGLKDCNRMLALVDGSDTGTIFEVGYAVALGIPVVALAEALGTEDAKMIVGSGCRLTDDLTTAIYQTAWL